MRLIELVRRPPSWLRIAFAGLALAFVLSSIAHVTHRHEALPGSAAHAVACSYCLSFGGLADASVQRTQVPSALPTDEEARVATPALLSYKKPSAAQPRAPPIS